MQLNEVKSLIEDAPLVLVYAGAGMSADLGIPTYWSGQDARYGAQQSEYGYTDFEHARSELWETEPEIQSAFFAQKAEAFAAVDPAQDASPYRILQDYLACTGKDAFIITTNPDSMFYRIGFDAAKLYELHGTYRFSQCLAQPQAHGVFETVIHGGLLVCPACGSLARPNTLFFQDTMMNKSRLGQQADIYHELRAHLPAKTIALEIGAGNTVPVIKTMTRKLQADYRVPMIRINPDRTQQRGGMEGIYRRDPTVPLVHIPLGATDGLKLLLA